MPFQHERAVSRLAATHAVSTPAPYRSGQPCSPRRADQPDKLLTKTPEASTAEILAKVVAHNLCVLIQAFHELGIDPYFAPPPTAGQIAG